MVIDVIIQTSKDKKISEKSLAIKTGISLKKIHDYFKKRKNLPGTDFLEIVKALDLSPKDFY